MTTMPTDPGARDVLLRDFLLVDETEGIRRAVKTVALYSIPTGVGLRFEKLDEQTAVEIGVIIGKHNAARSAARK